MPLIINPLSVSRFFVIGMSSEIFCIHFGKTVTGYTIPENTEIKILIRKLIGSACLKKL